MKRYLVAAGFVLMFAAPADAATQIVSATFPVPNFSCDGQERSAPIGPAPSTLTVVGAEAVFGSDNGFLNYAYLKDPTGNTMLIGGEFDIHIRQFFPTGTGFAFSTGQTGQLIVNCLSYGAEEVDQMGAAVTIYYTPAGAATQIFSTTFPVPNFNCDGQEHSTRIGPAPATLTVIGAEVHTLSGSEGPLNYAYLKDPAGNTMLIAGEFDLHVQAFFPIGTGYGFSTGQTGELIVNCFNPGGSRQIGLAATLYYTLP